jgi:hypothetical protein
LLDGLGPRLDVESVLIDLPGDARHFYLSPCKNILVALEEVDELAFLFQAQAGPDLDRIGRVLNVNLHGLGILDDLLGVGHVLMVEFLCQVGRGQVPILECLLPGECGCERLHPILALNGATP